MKKKLKTWVAPVLCGLFIFALFRFVLFIGYVPSASMEPTIRAESFVFGRRVIPEIRRGDILVFERDGVLQVKRVAGVPGDVIYLDDTRLTFSVGEALPGHTRVLTVPNGCYFMIGDNAEHSIDSRVWEELFVERAQVVAVVFAR